jgi:hypothetical protein
MARVPTGIKENDLTIRDGYALFWNEWPSNWTYSPFILDGHKYNCVEQYFMAEKARLFKDDQALRMIIKAIDPADQKRYGKGVKGFDERKWSSVCFDVMLRGNLEKYKQNPKLCEKLLDTGNLGMVEASPKDKIWGIGMDKNHVNATKPSRWLGKNLLGKVLDQVRTMIRQERGS